MQILCIFLIVSTLFLTTESIRCYKCSHRNFDFTDIGAYDRIQESVSLCTKVDTCEGEWCIQILNLGTVTFSCAEVVPKDDPTFDTEADYQLCQSYYNDEGSALLISECFCKNEDYCNGSLVNDTETTTASHLGSAHVW